MSELKTTASKDWYSVEEYKAILAASETRVEYLNGQIRFMAGGSINHSILSAKMGRILGNKLNDKSCIVFNSDLKVYIDKKNSYVLPDVSVACGKIETSDKDKDAITNPIIIVEVLSESTQNYDFTEKFSLYRSLKSLKEYIIVAQDKKRIEVYTRKDGLDIFQVKSYTAADEFIYLESIDVQISIVELYKDIEF